MQLLEVMISSDFDEGNFEKLINKLKKGIRIDDRIVYLKKIDEGRIVN